MEKQVFNETYFDKNGKKKKLKGDFSEEWHEHTSINNLPL